MFISALERGTKLHKRFSAKRDDPLKLRNRVFTRWCGAKLIKGMIDDYELSDGRVKIIEVFTTENLTEPALAKKMLQLNCYQWLLAKHTQVHPHGWVVVFDPYGRRIKTVQVEYIDPTPFIKASKETHVSKIVQHSQVLP